MQPTGDSNTSFIRELEVGDNVVKIKQLCVGDVGCVVWDAAIALSKFLENKHYFPDNKTATSTQTDRDLDCNYCKSTLCSHTSGPGAIVCRLYWTGKRVVDLGSGTGVVGISAGVLGADVTVTDLPEFIDLMSTNIRLNEDVILGSVIAKSLRWGQDVSSFLPSPDIVLMADVVYYEESMDGLVKTLVDLCGKSTQIIMCYEERTTGNKPEIEKKFFKLMEKCDFQKNTVPYEKLDSTFRSRDIHVVIFNKP